MEATGAEAFCDLADHWMHPHPVADAGTGEVGTQGEQGPLVPQDILLCPRPQLSCTQTHAFFVLIQ